MNVKAARQCAWTATTSASWIRIKSGASGNGDGKVEYRVDANPAAAARTGTVMIAGQTVTVSQAAAKPDDD